MYWLDYLGLTEKSIKPKKMTFPFKKKMLKSSMNLDDFLEAMSYPFEERFYKKDMYRPLVDTNMKIEKVDLRKINFTQKSHILQLYWFVEGINDDKAWEFIAKIKYGENDYRFIYFVAACDYTGFDCQGFMKFYVSKDMDRLLKFAVEMETIEALQKYKF